jgi:hypothetical protein
MSPDELYRAAAELRLSTREKFHRDEAAYDRAIVDLTSAMRGTDLSALWRAAVEASRAEDALVGSSDVVGAVYDQLGIPDCYEPGEPVEPGEHTCEGYTGSDYCTEHCPLNKREKATPVEVAE